MCNECQHENVCPVLGPGEVYLEVEDTFIDFHVYTPVITFDHFYDFYRSNTYGEWGEGHCPHIGYKLEASAVDMNGNAIKGVDISYEPVPEHFDSVASAVTTWEGEAILYAEPGTITVKADLTSPSDPSKHLTQTQEVEIIPSLNKVMFQFDVQTKHVFFQNSQAGDPAHWPADISFLPFYSEYVMLPTAATLLPYGSRAGP